jgi:hypothetical protein
MRRACVLVTLAALLAASLHASTPTQAAPPQPAAAAAPAVCSQTWVGHEAEFEEALRNGKVARLEDVPIGVTKPQRGILEPPTPVARFVWKPIRPGYKAGYMESYKAEIAAYELDKLLGMGMVPPYVERKVQGLTGAAGYWIEDTKSWDIKSPPSGPEPQWSYQLSRMKLFDMLIANIDRNQGNLIYDADWHLFLIDHTRAFIGKKDLKGFASLSRVDRKLWEKMSALTFEQLKAALGEWVSDGDLRALLTRRDLIARNIAEMVKQRGDSVFFN